MWFIGVEGEQEMSAPPPKKNPGSAPGYMSVCETMPESLFYGGPTCVLGLEYEQ